MKRTNSHRKDASNHKYLQVPCEFKAVNDEGQFSGYASIFGNVDLGGDVIERGAFARGDMQLTKDGMVRIALQHRLSTLIGKAHVEQDDKGLKFDGQLLLGLSAARETHIQMKAGVLDAMSIGYDSLEDEMMTSGIRKLKRLKLYEISVVPFGMNPEARIETVKARARQVTTIREFEDLLREECGFSAAQAKLLASGGWKTLQKARDESCDEEQAVEGLTKFLNTIAANHS